MNRNEIDPIIFFRMISSSEILYFTGGIKQGIRADGRACDAIRPLKIDLGVIPTANGSCRIQSRGCDIYVAIKCDIGRPSTKNPNEGIVNVAVEFGCSVLPRLQDFTGRQATMEADAFADIVANHISSLCITGLNKQQFCIEPARVCWNVSIDVLVERIDGPLLDPISIGVRAALMDLELPVVAVSPESESARDGGEKEPIIPKVELTGGLWRISPQQSSAICVSIGVYCDSSVIMVDLDRIEENIAKLRDNALVSVAVNEAGECCGIHKFGAGSVDPLVFRDVVSAGLNVGKQVASLLTRLGKNKL